MARIILFATTDIVCDQRVHRTSMSLHNAGHKVLTVGRRLKTTPKMIERKYKVKNFRLFFTKGPLFYFSFNLRIFLFLLFSKFDLVCSNDLDSILGCRLGCFFRGKSLVYDSHELFTEVPELINRKFTRWIWLTIEKWCVKGVQYSSTVSQSIADEYYKRYGLKMEVIRNVPFKNEIIGHKANRPTLIYQGALNKGRGIDLAINMMNHLSCYYLLIVGEGDLEVDLRRSVINQNLLDRVEFRGRLSAEEMHNLTCKSWLGLSLEEDICMNYRYALPNKIFDYVQALIPVLVSDLPEMKKVVKDYGIGIIADSRDPKQLADQVADFFEDKNTKTRMAKILRNAAQILVWEKEEPKLIQLYNKALQR